MNSVRTYSSAATATDADGSWTQVTGGRRSTASGWGTPSVTAPATQRKPFSFASTETAAALDPTTATPAKKSATPGGNWASSRPGGAVSAAKAAIPRPLDIRSMSDFPTLGSSSAPPVGRSTAVSWSNTVASRITPAEDHPKETFTSSSATDEVDATLSFLRNRRQPSATAAVTAAAPSRTSRLAAIGTRCFDDGPTDYDGPEEDDDGAGSYHVPEEGEEHGEGELNADLAVTRRAGDKSDW